MADYILQYDREKPREVTEAPRKREAQPPLLNVKSPLDRSLRSNPNKPPKLP